MNKKYHLVLNANYGCFRETENVPPRIFIVRIYAAIKFDQWPDKKRKTLETRKKIKKKFILCGCVFFFLARFHFCRWKEKEIELQVEVTAEMPISFLSCLFGEKEGRNG